MSVGRKSVFAAVFTVLQLTIASALLKVAPTLPSCFERDTVYNSGHRVVEKVLDTPLECQNFCQLHKLCSHFSYYHASKTCYLRNGNKKEHRIGITSGPRDCTVRNVVPTAEPRNICVESICLRGGRSTMEGDVYLNNSPVCDHGWSMQNGAVVCRQLGFPGVKEVTTGSAYGSKDINYTMDDVLCNGNETMLGDCYHSKREDCRVGEVAGVICSSVQVDIPEKCFGRREICLIGGSAPNEGNVYFEGKPVCHHSWDYIDALVACRQLGYLNVKNITTYSHFGVSNSYSNINELECDGDEDNLLECLHDDLCSDCNYETVAGVVCSEYSKEKLANTFYYSTIQPLLISGIVLFCLALLALGLFVGHRIRRRNKKMQPVVDELPGGNIFRFRNPMTSDLETAVENPIQQQAVNPVAREALTENDARETADSTKL